jgi:hypothetical protein
MDDQGTTGVRAFFLKEKRPEEVGVDDFGLIRHAPPFGAWHQPVGRSAPLRSRFKSFDKVERPDLTGGFLKEAGHENRHRRLQSLFSN